MNILFLFTSIFFFLWTIRNILFWVYLWQLKEYRFDRMKIHLFETNQGRTLLFSYTSLFQWITLLGCTLLIFKYSLLLFFQFLIFFILAFHSFLVLKEVYARLIKRPVFSFKAIIIILLSFFIQFLLFLIPLIDRFLWVLILVRLIPYVVSGFVLIFSFPTELHRDMKVEKAAKKIREYKDILVIGITGSYGKSSTKEYVSQILDKKFNVAKTQGTNNTPIGIADTILSRIQKDTEIFIVEMGAYKIKEILDLCKIVRPRIGILTAVNNQHASLFGGIENTIRAKYELMQSLPKNGLALFNGNNVQTRVLYEKTRESLLDPIRKEAVLYTLLSGKINTTKELLEKTPCIVAKRIKVNKTSVIFSVEFLLPGQTRIKEITNIKAPVIGIHNIEDILPGIYIACYLGMTSTEIIEAVKSLLPLQKTMSLFTRKGISYIDDTFNSNPQAVRSALAYMRIYNTIEGKGGKKFLVLQPMIELGEDARREHYYIGKEISAACDYLLLTNKNFYFDITRGVSDAGGVCEVRFGNAKRLSEFILKKVEKNDVVVFEGKEASAVLQRVL